MPTNLRLFQSLMITLRTPLQLTSPVLKKEKVNVTLHCKMERSRRRRRLLSLSYQWKCQAFTGIYKLVISNFRKIRFTVALMDNACKDEEELSSQQESGGRCVVCD
jgi:hypothetical protein